jgi:hypothetical protein
MAKSLTGSFYLTDSVLIAAAATTGARVQGTIDLGAYISVPNGQALAIDKVDFIYQQGADFDGNPQGLVGGDACLGMQVTDLNPETAFVRADDASLVASGSMAVDHTNNVASHVSDLYPDNFGSLSEAFMVVNDTLYIVGGVDGAGAIPANGTYITARIRARIVKLSKQDWMALALQSVSSDS